jgi:hypothetical protein
VSNHILHSVSLDPWENLKTLQLSYESTHLDTYSWDMWKAIFRSATKRFKDRELKVENLGISTYPIPITSNGQHLPELLPDTRTSVKMNLTKEDVPELGTRPIYFYRKPNWKTATPQEFWGFFTFNKDPTGPTGLHIRERPDGCARIVSDSLPSDAPDSPQEEPNINM